MSTTAADALVIVFAQLSPPDERREVLERMTEVQARREAGEMSDTERVLRSLRAVAVHVGHEPSVDEYKQAREELRAAGEEVEGITRVIRHFGSWRRAKEALALSETTTAKRIEARSATAGWARSGGPGSPSTRARTVCYVQMFDDRRYPNG